MVLQVEQIRADIRDFCQSSGVDKVIVLWTANTERFCDIIPGVNDSAKNLLAAIKVRACSKNILVTYQTETDLRFEYGFQFPPKSEVQRVNPRHIW